MNDTVQHASDRLLDDTRAVESAARRIMDSITGEWGCEGRPSVPRICAAAQTIVDATGRLGVALEKAALEISTRAPDCYIDRLGSTTDATAHIREIAADLLTVGEALKALPERAHAKEIRQLGSIGERATDHTKCSEKCAPDCSAPVYDDEEFYDGERDRDGDYDGD